MRVVRFGQMGLGEDMLRICTLTVCVAFASAVPTFAQVLDNKPVEYKQVENYKPVTNEMLLHPSPDDWLMFSRTYDAWRYSPLAQINTKNVSQLRMAWVRGLPEGVTETIPIVHDGVMYVIAPGGMVDALDATNGDLIWEYKRE